MICFSMHSSEKYIFPNKNISKYVQYIAALFWTDGEKNCLGPKHHTYSFFTVSKLGLIISRRTKDVVISHCLNLKNYWNFFLQGSGCCPGKYQHLLADLCFRKANMFCPYSFHSYLESLEILWLLLTFANYIYHDSCMVSWTVTDVEKASWM